MLFFDSKIIPYPKVMPNSNFSTLKTAVRRAKRKDRLLKEKELRSKLCAANAKICELQQKIELLQKEVIALRSIPR